MVTNVANFIGGGISTGELANFIGGGISTGELANFIGGGISTGEPANFIGGGISTGEPASFIGGGIRTGELKRVEGAASALIADRARTEPTVTHETFNHDDVIGISPQKRQLKLQRRLTQRRQFVTTKVLRSHNKMSRKRLLVSYGGKYVVTMTKRSRYRYLRGWTSVSFTIGPSRNSCHVPPRGGHTGPVKDSIRKIASSQEIA